MKLGWAYTWKCSPSNFSCLPAAGSLNMLFRPPMGWDAVCRPDYRCVPLGQKRGECWVLSHLARTHLLPSTPSPQPPGWQYSTYCLWQIRQYIGTSPCCTLDPFLIQFLRWKTAEDNCSRRIKVTLQEKQGANKQKGAVRALHKEERCGFIVVGKKRRMRGGHVMLLECNVFPTLGQNGSTPVLLLFLNSTAPVARHCRTHWRAQRTRERGGLEIRVEKLRLCLFFWEILASDSLSWVIND